MNVTKIGLFACLWFLYTRNYNAIGIVILLMGAIYVFMQFVPMLKRIPVKRPRPRYMDLYSDLYDTVLKRYPSIAFDFYVRDATDRPLIGFACKAEAGKAIPMHVWYVAKDNCVDDIKSDIINVMQREKVVLLNANGRRHFRRLVHCDESVVGIPVRVFTKNEDEMSFRLTNKIKIY